MLVRIFTGVETMDRKDMLLQEAQRLCETVGANFDEMSKELLDFIGSEVVLDYCITRGPLPNFPDTLADFFVLTETCLCDYEIRQRGNLHHVVPLNMIHAIGESFAQIGEENFLVIHFSYGIFSLYMSDKLVNKGQLRRFLNSVKNKIIDRSRLG